MRINFDLEDLEAFLAVKSTGAFHLAAERLSLSQSAVTRRIQKLEQALDVKLFERTTRSIKPTLSAKRLQPRAEAILEDLQQTARAMRDDSVAFAYQRNLVISVAIIPTVAARIMPRAIKAFRTKGSAARIRLIDTSANAVSEAVADGDADLGIGSMPLLDPGLRFDVLFEDPMVLVLPKAHHLADAPQITWDHLTEEEVILSARNTGNRVLIDDAMARTEAALRWTYETERSTTALALVAGGTGVAVLPLSLVQSVTDGRLAWRKIKQPEITRPVGILERANPSENPAVARFKEAIQAACN